MKIAVIKRCSFKTGTDMAQNMQTQGQTVNALIRLLSMRSDLGIHCLPEKCDMGLHC